MDYIIKNAIIVNEGKIFEASVWIENGLIKKISSAESEMPAGVKIIEGKGLHLLPGVIDTHVHFREPGFTTKADLESESRAAVAGGVTSFLDMPNTNPQTTTVQLLDEKIELASQKSLANFGFYLGATNENLDEILNADTQKVAAVKLFLGSSTGNMLVNKETALEKIFKSSPFLLVAHCEDEALIQQNTTHYKELYKDKAAPAGIHPLIRTTEACYKSTAKAVELAHKTNARFHVAHLTTAKELSLLEDKPLNEKRVTAEVCIHHLWYTDKDYTRLGNLIKCNPAIKTEQDREALREALKTNLLDVVSTDHAPHTWQEKQNEYFSAPSGIPFVQHSLQAALELHKQGVFSLETIVEKMCHNQAHLFKIQNRGFIREGYAADLVLINLKAEQQIEKSNILYKCGWSPLEGETLHTSIAATFVNGALVYENGKINSEVKGMPLKFT